MGDSHLDISDRRYCTLGIIFSPWWHCSITPPSFSLHQTLNSICKVIQDCMELYISLISYLPTTQFCFCHVVDFEISLTKVSNICLVVTIVKASEVRLKFILWNRGMGENTSYKPTSKSVWGWLTWCIYRKKHLACCNCITFENLMNCPNAICKVKWRNALFNAFCKYGGCGKHQRRTWKHIYNDNTCCQR